MIVLIDKLPREGLEVSRDFEFSSSELLDESALFIQPAHAELKVKKIGEGIFVKGKIVTWLSLICSRCLMPYKYYVDLKCDLVYLPEEPDELKEELSEDDMNNIFYRNRQIDLREVVLEQINLSFPVKPLCSEECQGICPACGKNQRFGKCDCAVEDSDLRLNTLKTFIKDRR